MHWRHLVSSFSKTVYSYLISKYLISKLKNKIKKTRSGYYPACKTVRARKVFSEKKLESVNLRSSRVGARKELN